MAHVNTANASRHTLACPQHIPPLLKFALYRNCVSSLRLGISRLQAQGVSYPPLNPRPPEDISYKAPENQDTHEFLHLYKSLFRLAQRLTSQRGASILSPGSIYASDSPVSSQAQYNSTPTSGSSTTGRANNAEQNIEQNPKSSLEEATINTELANLDANSLMELGNFFYSLAFQRDPTIADLALPHEYVPDPYAFPSEVPVPLPLHLNNPSSSETFVGTTYLSTSDDERQPITHASTSFGVTPSSTHLHSSACFPPYFNPSEPPTTALPNNSNTVHNVPPCTAVDEFNSHFRTFHVNDPSIGPSRPKKSNKALHVCSKCNQRFHRPSSLADHMHTHTGVKRHKCSICGTRFSWTSGFARHMSVIHGDGKASKRQR